MPLKRPTAERIKILNSAFVRAKKKNPAFSLRALATKLEMSPGFLSKIMTGKSELPQERVEDFVKALKLDLVDEKALLDSYVNTRTRELGLSGRKESKINLAGAAELPDKYLFLLERWFMMAVLDLALCEGFDDDPAFIARRLGITPSEARSALEILKGNGFLAHENGRWVKVERVIRFPAVESREPLRKFHDQMLKRAIAHMHEKTSPEDYSRRQISGFMTPANPANLEKARARMNEAMQEVVEILQEGEVTELYYFADILFPLTSR